jgi:hypothetical protein
VVQVQKIAEGTVAPELASVGSGAMSIAAVVTNNTGSALAQEVSAATIGLLVPPKLTVSDAKVTKSSTGQATLQFTVSIDRAPTQPVSADYTTQALSAISGVDFLPTSGTLTWAPGDSSSRTVSVPVTGDMGARQMEALQLWLTNLTGAVALAWGPFSTGMGFTTQFRPMASAAIWS